MVYKFRGEKKKSSRAHGRCEEPNKVLELSMIITNYWILVINAYYTYIK